MSTLDHRSLARASRLNLMASVLLVIALVIAALAVAARYSVLRWTQNAVQTGDTLLELSDVDYSVAKRTLLFFLDVDCPYCTSSLPLYRELMHRYQTRLKGHGLRFVAVSSDTEARFAEYVQSERLGFDQTVAGDALPDRIPGVPALILVDSSGTVLNLWYGLLDDSAQSELHGVLTTEGGQS